MIVDHPLVARKLFFPRPSEAPPTFVVEAPGAQLACFRFHRHPGAGWLLHFHGNGETADEHAAAYAETFLDMGTNVCFAEYRGYGASTGAPGLGAMLPDGEAIARALGDPERTVAYGRSFGCVFAIELARRLPRLGGLVLESGLSDVGEWLRARLERSGGTGQLNCTPEELESEVRTGFDFEGTLGAYKGPLLVMHALGDPVFGPEHAERLHAWGGGEDKRLVLFPKGDHNTILSANAGPWAQEVEGLLHRAGTSRG